MDSRLCNVTAAVGQGGICRDKLQLNGVGAVSAGFSSQGGRDIFHVVEAPLREILNYYFVKDEWKNVCGMNVGTTSFFGGTDVTWDSVDT